MDGGKTEIIHSILYITQPTSPLEQGTEAPLSERKREAPFTARPLSEGGPFHSEAPFTECVRE